MKEGQIEIGLTLKDDTKLRERREKMEKMSKIGRERKNKSLFQKEHFYLNWELNSKPLTL